MKSIVDFEKEAGLSTFKDIVVEVLNSNIQSITSASPEITLQEAYTCTPAELIAGYESSVLISASEEHTGVEMGLCFGVKEITMLADMMMMGDGEAKTDLDEDLKDAVKEFANQFFGALVVPVDTKLGKKLQFEVEDVQKLQGSPAFQSDSYVSFDIQGVLKESPFFFKFFLDDAFLSVLNKGAGGDDDIGMGAIPADFFGGVGGGEETTRMPSGPMNPNMEMLMDIEIPVSVRMGSSRLFLKDILGLGPGNIVELDQDAGEAVELAVNDKLIARGEVVIVDGYFGFRIKEIISKAERLKKLKD
ncbi:MAG: flagellar motor switch protein FliN [Deferribacteraceae bacterium]|jgi:flagellar motor switch protein FliN/FliY|nr:flagellar motor switch protein FliN [Deferribacteraceae bacterium]